MTAWTSRARTVAALALAGALALTGCTGDAEEPAAPPTTEQSAGAQPGGVGSSDPGTATVADRAMAEQTVATPNGLGGEVTVTLRAVEVAGQRMTVQWALRWDHPDASANQTVSYASMGISPVTTVTDRENLVVYRPFCTEGAWQPEGAGEQDVPLSVLAQIGQEQQRCKQSMLVSPPAGGSFAFPHHGTIEAWAVLPAPEGRPESVDVGVAEGLPLFTDATVTYTGGEG